MAWNKLRAVLMLLPIVLDCLGNWLVGGSFDNTLSAEAWNHRKHPVWGWTHRFIDGAFRWQKNHCKVQAEREAKYGSVWSAWLADYRGELARVTVQPGQP